MVTKATKAKSERRWSHGRRRTDQARPPRQRAPGNRMAIAMRLEPRRGIEPSCCCVVKTTELVTAAVALGRISTFSGLNVQEDWSGRPEQERVMNMGELSAELFTGVMEVMIVPDAPRPRVSEAGAIEI